MTKEVFCGDCAYYGTAGEYRMSCEFIYGRHPVIEDEKEIPGTTLFGELVSDLGYIKNCTHTKCFVIKPLGKDRITGKEQFETKRVEGCGTFNINHDCKYYQPKLWKKIKDYFNLTK